MNIFKYFFTAILSTQFAVVANTIITDKLFTYAYTLCTNLPQWAIKNSIKISMLAQW